VIYVCLDAEKLLVLYNTLSLSQLALCWLRMQRTRKTDSRTNVPRIMLHKCPSTMSGSQLREAGHDVAPDTRVQQFEGIALAYMFDCDGGLHD
jgi:hypothetical protein